MATIRYFLQSRQQAAALVVTCNRPFLTREILVVRAAAAAQTFLQQVVQEPQIKVMQVVTVVVRDDTQAAAAAVREVWEQQIQHQGQERLLQFQVRR
jgi:molybdopterin-guanine dinucleotide biosynthesis protein A